MKTNYLKSILVVIFTIQFFSINAGTYHSVAAGGNWNSTTTWEEGSVPSATDDVIITGPGTVYVNVSSACNDLTVNSGAVIQNSISNSITLTVNGSIVNNGSVLQGTASFTVDVYGNITNNGVWEHYRVRIYSTGTHEFSQGAGSAFNLDQMNVISGLVQIDVLTNLSFIGTNIILNEAIINMPVSGGSILSLDDAVFNNGTLNMNSGTIYMANDARLNATTVSNAIFTGTCSFTYNVTLTGDIINNGIIQNRVGYSVTSTFDCNFTNNGTVQNSNAAFTISTTGNIINKGTWSNFTLQFTGNTDQDIRCENNHYFSVTTFSATDAIGKLNATGDLAFVGCTVNLNGAELDGNNFEIYMTKKGSIWATTRSAVLTDFVLTGTHIIYDQNVIYQGNIVVEDTLKNQTGSTILLNINGSVTNNGIITTSTASFNINLSADLINNGIFTPGYVFLTGSSNQNISCGITYELGCTQLNDSDSLSSLTLLSDVTFNGTVINMENGYVILPSAKGSNLILSGAKVSLSNIVANGNIITMNNNGTTDAGLEGNVMIENATLDGTVIVNGLNNILTGDIINQGTIKNRVGNTIALNIAGNIVNNGTIQNSNAALTINVGGNINNNGIWSNSYLRLNGAADQQIACLNGNAFSCANFINDKTSGNVLASGDLLFSGVTVDFNGTVLDASSGYPITANDGYFYDITIDGFGNEITCGNDHYFYYSYLNDVRLYGTLNFSTGCSLTDVTNNGLLQNILSNTVVIESYGTLLNTGTIQNSNVNLSINVYGDIINSGTWDNYRTNIAGSSDQQILIIDNNDITGDVRFESDIITSPYQWLVNGFILNSTNFSGETTAVLTWLVPVSPTYNGTYICQTGGGNSRNIQVGGKDILIDAGIALEGAFNGTDMNTTLNDADYLPLTQPFNTLPWNYGGAEEVGSMPNTDIVDWVLLELRDAPDAASATPATVYARKAAFLLKNGAIVSGDGTSFVEFVGTITNNLFLVVWHRNHLGIMSAVPLVKAGGLYTYNFTTGAGQAYGTNPQTELAPGVWGMINGDGNGDGVINPDDKTIWNNDGAKSGYYDADYDMNGMVTNQDKNDIWYIKIGTQSQVPQ